MKSAETFYCYPRSCMVLTLTSLKIYCPNFQTTEIETIIMRFFFRSCKAQRAKKVQAVNSKSHGNSKKKQF